MYMVNRLSTLSKTCFVIVVFLPEKLFKAFSFVFRYYFCFSRDLFGVGVMHIRYSTKTIFIEEDGQALVEFIECKMCTLPVQKQKKKKRLESNFITKQPYTNNNLCKYPIKYFLLKHGTHDHLTSVLSGPLCT